MSKPADLPTALPYFPRPQLLESVLKLLMSGANVTLFAPRRHGKTWFVRYELLPALHEAGWFAGRVDLWRNRDNPALGLVEGLEALAYASPKSVLPSIRSLTIRSVRSTFKLPGVDIEGEWVPSTGHVTPEGTLENRLANALQMIASKGGHAVLALDEFQALADKSSDNFVAAFRTALQDLEGGLSVIFTGSSRLGLTNLFKRAKAPLFRSAEAVTLPHLGDDFVDSRADYLRDIAGIEVDRGLLKNIFPKLCHTPLFINEIVRNILVSGSPDVVAALAQWVEAKKSEEYSELLDRLSDLDLAVIVWLTMSGQTSVYTEEAREFMKLQMGVEKRPEYHQIQTSMRRLTAAQIVEPTGTNGGYEIADQGFQVVLSIALFDAATEFKKENGIGDDPVTPLQPVN